MQIISRSHQALSLGQTGCFGGIIGTTIASLASCAATTGLTHALLMGSGATGIGVGVIMLIAGSAGCMQGLVRYPIHYCLSEKLDTTWKKIAGLALEYLASIAAFYITWGDLFHSPLTATLFFASTSFALSVIACTILGLAFIQMKKCYQSI